MSFLVLVVLTFATYRLARAIAEDDITEGFRRWVSNQFGPGAFLSRLVICSHCIGFWLAFLVVGVWAWATNWPLDFPESVVYALGVAGGQSLLATVSHRLDTIV